MRGSRSSLRRIGVPYQGRKRWYVLRFLCLALIVAAILAFLVAVQTQYFAKDGLGAVIYGFHDRIYLWAKGQAWVQLFPYALIWLIPAAIAVTLVAIEFTTPLDPIRHLHRRLTLSVVRFRWTQRFLARPLGSRQINPKIWTASLTPSPDSPARMFGFARRVIRRAQEDAWRQTATALVEGTQITARQGNRLALLSGMRLRFDPSDAVGHLRALEVIAATPNLPETQKLVARLSDFYAAQKQEGLARPLATVLTLLRDTHAENQTDATAELSRISTALETLTHTEIAEDAPLELACHALVANVIGWRCALPETGLFQRLWVRCRLIAEPLQAAQAIEVAEGLIFFELWSKLAEVAPTPLQERSLLALALGSKAQDVPGLMAAPETFAWTGATR